MFTQIAGASIATYLKMNISQWGITEEGFTAIMDKVTKIESIYILKPLDSGKKHGAKMRIN